MDILSRLQERYGRDVESKLEDYLTRRCPNEFKHVVLYQIRTGGKRVRPLLTLLFAEACGLEYRKALPEACIVELIHEYSLIFDDIIDRSLVRRGKNTLWKEFGTVTAILAGLWYREAIEEAIMESRNPQVVMKLVADTIREIIDGERLDILMETTGREDSYYHTYRYASRLDKVNLLELYYNMISKKTAALFKLCTTLGAVAATGTLDHPYVEIARTYGQEVGLAFQLIDDLLDVYGEFKKFGKEIGKDLKEHKLGNVIVTLTLIKASSEDRQRILSILSKEKVSDEDIKELLAIFDKYNVREDVIARARQHIENAMRAIEKLPVSGRVEELKALAKFIVEREF